MSEVREQFADPTNPTYLTSPTSKNSDTHHPSTPSPTSTRDTDTRGWTDLDLIEARLSPDGPPWDETPDDELRGLVAEVRRLLLELDRTEGDLAVAVREASNARAERDALSAVIAEYEQQDEQVMALKAFAIYVSDLGRPSALMRRRFVSLDELIGRANAVLAAGLAVPVGETPDEPQRTRTAADLLREIAARDPEAHNAALARGYGVGPALPVEEQRR